MCPADYYPPGKAPKHKTGVLTSRLTRPDYIPPTHESSEGDGEESTTTTEDKEPSSVSPSTTESSGTQESSETTSEVSVPSESSQEEPVSKWKAERLRNYLVEELEYDEDEAKAMKVSDMRKVVAADLELERGK